MNNQEPTRECCGTCRQVVKKSMTSTSMPTEQGYETIQCSDQFCPNCHWTPNCHSIKPPKECCKESCPYLKCHTGRHGVVSTMCTDKCDCSCHSIKPPIATNSQDSYEVKDESKLTSQDLPEEECEVCKMFPEDGHPHEELSPELSWDIMKFIVTDGGWSSDIDVEKSNKKLSAFIKKVEQQAFNSGRASMAQEAVELSDRMENEAGHTEFNEWKAFKRFRNNLRDILQALKNKETK